MKEQIGETGAAPGRDAEYGEELLCANWNPVLAVLDRAGPRTTQAARPRPRRMREQDVQAFLLRIYTAGA